MDSHRLALKPGYVLEHFRIERVLGKGGFGITYLAVDVRLGKRVALKELLPDTIATRVEGSTVAAHSKSLEDDWQWAKERFMEEAQMLAGFSHPAIVGVHWLSQANGTVYMAMDYIEGESYEERLKRIGTESDEASLMAVIGPVLEGLEEVHAKGLLHRDIKPENILIKSNGQPVLIDFGAARESVGKTVTMTSIVTHGYSPIEQYQSKGKMGPWTDIYAVGALMCRAITGEKPPVAADRVMEDEFEWLSYREIPEFSEEFRQTVDWALRVKPAERPQSLGEFGGFAKSHTHESTIGGLDGYRLATAAKEGAQTNEVVAFEDGPADIGNKPTMEDFKKAYRGDVPLHHYNRRQVHDIYQDWLCKKETEDADTMESRPATGPKAAGDMVIRTPSVSLQEVSLEDFKRCYQGQVPLRFFNSRQVTAMYQEWLRIQHVDNSVDPE